MIAITTAFAATWTTVTSKETGSYSSAFKFLAFANAFTCGFALLFLSFVFFFGRHGLNPTNHLLFLHDMFLMSLMLSGVAVGTAFGYLGRRGNSHAGLRPFEQVMPVGDHVYVSNTANNVVSEIIRRK